MAIGAILGNILKDLVLNKAKEEAEKTGASPKLIDALTKKITEGEEKTSAEIKDSDERGEGAPEIEITDRTFEEQLGFKPKEEAPAIPQQLPQQMPQVSGDVGLRLAPRPEQQIVPGPGGQQIAGIPQAQTPRVPVPPKAPGFFAGAKESLLGLPTTGGQIPEARTGRQTAFGAGGLVGDILRKGVGLTPTSGQPQIIPFIDPTTGEVKFTSQRGARTVPREKEDPLQRLLEEALAKGDEIQEDQFAGFREQLKEGEILVLRKNNVTAITPNELLPTDTKL